MIFSCPSVYTYVLGAHKNCLVETVLLSTHNICLLKNKKNNFQLYTLILSSACTIKPVKNDTCISHAG